MAINNVAILYKYVILLSGAQRYTTAAANVYMSNVSIGGSIHPAIENIAQIWP